MAKDELLLSAYLPKITGSAKYLDDLKFTGLLYAAFVRSPYPHARIKYVNTVEAESLEGVKKVITGKDIIGRCGSLHVLVEAAPPASNIPPKYPLAIDKVTYQGEAVAVVIADDPYVANDAAELVGVEYEPLPHVLDPLHAMSEGAPIIHENLQTNLAFRWTSKTGDVDMALASSSVVIQDRFKVQRVAGVALEPRGTIATYDRSTNQLIVWSTTHRPHALKTSIAEIVGHPENRVRVIVPSVGGSFGSKTNTYPEEILIAYLAKELGATIKWVATRREDFISATHGRDVLADVTAGFDSDGRLQALRARVIADLGAYWHRYAHAAPLNVAKLLSGCYKVSNFEAEVIGVYTNKMATHVYRGTGRPEAAYIIEKIMDRAARQLKIDPAEIRMKNFIRSDEFPYKNPAGYVYDSGDYVMVLRKALEQSDYAYLKSKRDELRRMGKLVGIGVINYVEVCSVAGGWEYAELRVEPTGKITVLAGISSHGQYTDVTLKKIVAQELEINPSDVEVLSGDTAVVPYGWGSVASRSLMTAGSAVLRAAQNLKEKLIDIAATLLEIRRDDLEYRYGKVQVRGSPETSLTISEIAKQVYAHHGISSKAQKISTSLNVYDFYHVEPSFPYGSHVCMVEIDPETGSFKILRYVAVDDCGRIVSKPLVEGQIIGGVATGLAQVWLEEIIYNEDGINVTSDMSSYAIPSATETPLITTSFTEVPSRNALGVKGSGESGVVGALPALSNALEDALSPVGAKINELPINFEKIWRLLKQTNPRLK